LDKIAIRKRRRMAQLSEGAILCLMILAIVAVTAVTAGRRTAKVVSRSEGKLKRRGPKP
jgi:hypothetical protein